MIIRTYASADLPALYQYLADAQAARAKILTGGQITSVSYEGKSVSYSPGTIDALLGWIRDLTDTIGWLESGQVTRSRRPILGAF